jgi:Uri superfamily endonuclease
MVWPRAPGAYALVLHLTVPIAVRVGRLGEWALPSGWHVYVGSALGAGGLRGRLARHFRTEKKLRWHIDYVLAANVDVSEVWYVESSARWECVWARQLAALPGARVLIPRFGAGDCHCPSHLLAFEASPPFEAFAHQVNELGCVTLQRFLRQPELPP